MTLIILQQGKSNQPIDYSKGERNKETKLSMMLKIKKTINTDTVDLKKVKYD